MNERLNIEELFQSKLEGVELKPSPKVWKATSRAVRRKLFFRFNPGRLNIFYVSAFTLLSLGTAYVLLNNDTKSSEAENLPDSEISKQITTDDESLNELKDSVAYIISPGANESIVEAEASASPSSLNTNSQNNLSTSDTAPVKSISSSNERRDSKNRELEDFTSLIAYFTPSVFEGCAPLEIEFTNASIGAISFNWSFGKELEYRLSDSLNNVTNGKTKYLFSNPGEYIVTLTVSNESGIQRSHSETISVHASPGADFEISNEQVYNYSIDANEFLWFLIPANLDESKPVNIDKFQTEAFSSSFQPTYIELSKAEDYNNTDLSLVLLAKNTFGCSDTSIMLLPRPASPDLQFPTAFSPNPNGSIGGYYNINEPTNTVFHPKFEEQPSSYKLRIFNKKGEIIFESSEINIGWDGYYKEARAAQGVYIYTCTGLWKNGDPYAYRGDITVLWK